MPSRRARRARPDGYVTTRRDGRFEIGWSSYDPVTGRAIRHKRILRRDEDPDRALEAAKLERDRGRMSQATGERLDDWIAEYLEIKRPRVRSTTLRTYRDEIDLRIRPYLGHRRLEDLTSGEIVRWQARLETDGCTISQRAKALNLLRMILNVAVKHERLSRNVARLAEMPRREHDEPLAWPTSDEIARIRAAVRGERLEAAFVLAVETGMRQGELLGLRWRDLSSSADGRARVSIARTLTHHGQHEHDPKTRAGRRSVPLSAEALDVLRAHRKRQLEDGTAGETGWIFTRRGSGRPLHANSLLFAFHALTDRLGMRRIRWHDLRHYRASADLLAGVPRDLVAARLGHSSADVTADLYGHLLDIEAGEWSPLELAETTGEMTGEMTGERRS